MPENDKPDSIISGVEAEDQMASYDRWFRAEVQAAIDDPRPSIPHDEAMARIRTTIDNAKKSAAKRGRAVNQEQSHDSSECMLALRSILLRWQQRLIEDPDEILGEIAGQDHYLNMGALALAKEVAQKTKNPDLLLLAGGIELLIAEREAQHAAEEQRALEAEWRVDEFRDQVRKTCNQYFFKESRFKPDLSQYWVAVENARSNGMDPDIIEGLEKYLNERKVIGYVYGEVRSRLGWRLVEEGMERLPTHDEIEIEISRAMADFYRRADKTVYDRLRDR